MWKPPEPQKSQSKVLTKFLTWRVQAAWKRTGGGGHCCLGLSGYKTPPHGDYMGMVGEVSSIPSPGLFYVVLRL